MATSKTQKSKTTSTRYDKPAQSGGNKMRLLIGALALTGANTVYQMMPDWVKEPVEDSVMNAAGLVKRTPSPDEMTARLEKISFKFENASSPRILGTATQPADLKFSGMLDHWYGMMGRHESLMQDDDNRAAYNTWMSQFDHLKNKSIAEKAQAVDAAIDKAITYKNDDVVYQRGDYWATPMQTIANKSGDCDDFTILKYYTLRHLGVPADRMYAAAVGSEGGKLDHMTLLVNTSEEGVLKSAWGWAAQKFTGGEKPVDFVILDNDSSELGKLVEQKDSRYKPYAAMNEKGFWAVPNAKGLGW